MYSYQHHRFYQNAYEPRLIGRIAQMRLSLAESARRVLRIEDKDAALLSERIREVADLLPGPDYRRHNANYLAAQAMPLFKNSPLSQTKTIAALSVEDIDRLLFVSALSSHGLWEPAPDRLKNAIFKEHAAIDLLRKKPLVTTYGAEDEFFGLQAPQFERLHNAVDYFDNRWMIDSDSSIEPDDDTEGRELISPPMDDKTVHRATFFQAFLQAAGAKAPLPCAFHIHAGITNTFNGMSKEICRQLLVNYIAIENDLKFLESPLTYHYRSYFPRHGGKKAFIQAVLNSNPLSGMEHNDESDPWSVVQPGGRRRSKLNFSSLSPYGTVEFRQHPGSTCPVEKAAWLKFVNGFVTAGADMVRQTNSAHAPADRELTHLRQLVKQLKADRIPAIANQNAPHSPQI